MNVRVSLLLLLSLLPNLVNPTHYKGGTVTWKPTSPTSNATLVEIQITLQHSWTLARFPCDRNLINTQGLYYDLNGPSTYPSLICQSTPSLCASSLFTTVNHITLCTDYNNIVFISTGAYSEKQSLSRSTNIDIAWVGGNWADEIYVIGGSPPGNLGWYVGTHIDLTKPIYPINSSPVTGSLPIIRVIENTLATIQIPVADWDTGQNLQCRFASNLYGYGTECSGVCGNLPGGNISTTDCTMTWFAVRKSYDIANSIPTSLYVAAVIVEDFSASYSSTIRLSAVPLQMLIYVYTPVAGSCSIQPNITGDRPNRACIGVDINVFLTERIVADVYCSGDSIVEFVTSSPLYMNKTAISLVAGYTNKFYIILTWTPIQDQYGPQVFCAAPIDQNGLTGNQYCINFVVGYRSPELIQPIAIQGSTSPLGTIFSNHSIFSISATNGVYHPNRNGTYIKIYLSSNDTLVWEVDCGWSPLVLYSGTTVIFRVPNPSWIPGENYYVLFDSGAVSGNVFCGPESAPIYDKTFWRFNIWDSGLSSTTTTTTTPATTHSITTRPLSTTTPIPNLTTTGIIITSSITETTTTITSTTLTTETTSTTTTVTPTTPPVTDMSVITLKDFETQCRLPILVMSIALYALLIPLKVTGLYTIFLKFEKSCNINHLRVAQRQKAFVHRLMAPSKT